MLQELPREILVLIFAKLRHRDLLQFLLVDKAFSAEVRCNMYWTHRLSLHAPTIDFFIKFANALRKGDWEQLMFYRFALSLPRGMPQLDYVPGQAIDFHFSENVRHYWRFNYTPSSDMIQIHLTVYANSIRRGTLMEFSIDRIRECASRFMDMKVGYPAALTFSHHEYLDYLI
jgi:hypothetical protein